ncbi:hypothetical protein LOTGIDRAFT_199824 [Lottia gigantea]|uniref:BPTI/Kunitz inhibitor domain-containing protein n=1 Tax=Lottia gigantea TaxID=225164 RepID=V4AXH2_LOTGI|nr:hypothetical protein LOTGIDRAFT_199824 [Lottia gigantea]ESP02283.1 hypothetical protein LOTGIDRAFT_199824 [Lottia gigantea]
MNTLHIAIIFGAVFGSSLAGPECKERMEIGPCDGAFNRYYYDILSSQCKLFSYGGCGGNKNNFHTYGECVKQCESQDVCQQLKVVGPCEALIPRYYFDTKTNTCQKFNYGGCLGNGNNFRNMQNCMTKCMPNHKG